MYNNRREKTTIVNTRHKIAHKRKAQKTPELWVVFPKMSSWPKHFSSG